MYHTIVKNLGRKNFERVNRKEFDALLKDCLPNIKHRFGGNHALGGERNDIEALRLWFQRLNTVAPDLRLTIVDIWAKGWPHKTFLFIRWTAAMRFPDGSPYNNHGVHVIQLRWGKVVSIDANEDSQIVDRYLQAAAAAGVKEAAMPPITS